ncbi:MAG: leucyl/phenylalanyl-tRNA--protein transferase [Phycisphaerales bacterium]|nr:leucyl/phenylalanyl-tRNA--protein transferase [Phycisphaerales bacterium]
MPRPPKKRPADAPPSADEIVGFFLAAYRDGAFPMADLPEQSGASGDPDVLPVARSIRWYQPDPRGVISLDDDGLHVPRSLSRRLKKATFTTTSDAAFDRVIRGCARPSPTRVGAWLDESLVRCYGLLHQRGYAHSIEVWSHGSHTQPTLVGGIYGVSIGAAFFAESMFSRLDLDGSGASGLALITLWNHLRACGYSLLDVQMANEHTLRFGVQEISHKNYMKQLSAATESPDRWKPL